MDYTLFDMTPPFPVRSEMGRVVVSPPSVMGNVQPEEKGGFLWCCNRAFLSEDSYMKHVESKEEHDKDVDFSTLPRTSPFERLGKALNDRESTEFWMLWKGKVTHTDGGGDVKVEPGAVDRIKTERDEGNRSISSEKPIKKIYVCPLCSMKIHACNKRRHMERNHVENGKYPCSQCCCVFALEANLRNHQSRVHEIRSTTVAMKNVLVSKAKWKLGNVSKRSPQVCKRPYIQGGSLYQCKTCGKRFNNSSNARDHMNIHTGARPYNCVVCGFRFAHKANLGRHLKVAHTENDQHFCEICSISFSSHQFLIRHNRTIHQSKVEVESPKLERIYEAQTSGASNVNHSRSASPSDSLQLPSLTLQHPSPNAKSLYECHVCHKELSCPQSWRGHMRIHQNLKPYVCKLCGQSFRLHSTRSYHIKTCHTDGNFPCKFCTCRFLSRAGLVLHMQKYHKSRKPLGFKIHSQTDDTEQGEPRVEAEPPVVNHQEDAPEVAANFKCQLCGKFLKSMNEFQMHKQVHKIFVKGQCSLCLKTFNNANNLGPHKKSAHSDGVHKCGFCCCRYRHTSGLFTHLVQMHGMLRNDWNFSLKCIKPTSMKRIQMEIYKKDVGDAKVPISSFEEISVSRPKTMFSTIPRSVREGYVECQICHASIQKKNVTFHMKRSHYNEGHWKCEICPCNFLKEQGLLRHKSLYHGPNSLLARKRRIVRKVNPPVPKTFPSNGAANMMGVRFVCTHCNKTFSTKRHLNYHVHAHKYGKTFSCNKCPMAFTLPSSLRNHQRRCHIANGKFKCLECACKFDSAQGLANHTKLHIAMRNNLENPSTSSNSAPANEAESPNLPSMNASESSSLPRMQYECNICHIKLSNSESIPEHKKRNHFHNGQFKCTKCPCKFMTLLALKCHSSKYHGNKQPTPVKRRSQEQDSPPLPVEQVSEQSYDSSTQDRNVCPHCYKVMSSRESLAKHLQIHEREEGEKKFECDICHLKFLHSDSVHNHKKNCHFHDGIHQCPHCTCKFQSSWGLIVHQNRYHSAGALEIGAAARGRKSGRGKFQCTFCDKIYSRKYFKEHMRIHARRGDSEGFGCDVCEMNFSSSDAVSSHKMECHPPDGLSGEFKCNLCPCKYQTSTGLEWHLKRFHGLSNEAARRSQDFQKIQEQMVTDEPRTAAVEQNTGTRREQICELCNLPLGGATKLSQHKKSSHVENGQFKCSYCTCVFATFRGLNRHRFYYHQSDILPHKNPEDLYEYTPLRKIIIKPPPSSILSTVGMAQRALKNSIQRTIGKHKCSLCGATFNRPLFLLQHTQKAHTNGQFRCSFCVCSFHSSYGLSGHMNAKHGSKSRGETSVSDHVTLTPKASSSSYRAPSNPDIKIRPKCKLCGISFKKGNILQHMKVAHSDGKYKCNLCCCTFHTTFGLVKHLAWKHSVNSPDTQQIIVDVNDTALCDDGDGDQEASETTRVAHNNHDLSCNICGMVLNRKSYLEKHKQVAHTNGRFKCKKCVCCFHSAVGLAKHVGWHQKQYPTMNHLAGVRTSNSAGVTQLGIKVNRSFLKTTKPKRPSASSAVYNIKCNLCGLGFSEKRYLVRHKMKAHTSGSYRCKLCSCSFLSVNGLSAHKRVYHHNVGNSSAPMVSLGSDGEFSKKAISPHSSNAGDAMALSQERYSIRPPRPSLSALNYRHRCDQCGLRFTKMPYLRRHKETAHTGGKYACDKCTCSFASTTALVAHKRIRHSTNSAKEDGGVLTEIAREVESNSQSTTNDNRRSPLRDRFPTIPKVSKRVRNYRLRCDLCGLRFAFKNYYDKHLRKAHVEGGVSCPSCPCSFASSTELGAHKRCYHSTETASAPNRIVPERDDAVLQSEPTQQNLPDQIIFKVPAAPTNPGNFKCRKCGIRFIYQRSLKTHVQKAHTGGAHACKLCSCTFDTIIALAAHKKYRHSKSNLTQQGSSSRPTPTVGPSSTSHVESHSWQDDYDNQDVQSNALSLKCSFCTKSFQNKKLLDKHLLCHTRPEQCIKCNGRFRTKDELTKHDKAAHGNGAYQCFICSCKFASAIGRKQHITFVHKNQKSSAWGNSENSANNFVIEHEQENYYDAEPILRVDATYSQQGGELEDDMDSIPILEETVEDPTFQDYSSSHNYLFHAHDENAGGGNESEPILQGYVQVDNGSHDNEEEATEFRRPLPPLQTHRVARKKTYCPKTRPMECTICREVCLGPEKLRAHMESHAQHTTGDHNESDENDDNSDDEIDMEEDKCAKCGVTFASREERLKHLEVEHDETGCYRCVYCPCTMKTEENLRYHFTTRHG